MNKDVTVLMLTCKKFEQCWEPFFILFKKYWPNCPFELIMGTDSGNYDKIKTIEVGEDLGWIKNCLYILKKIKSKKVIIFFEDFLPCEPFNSKRIEELVQISINNNIGCLRLQPCPGPTIDWEKDTSLGVLEKNAPYRFSWQTAIWDREFLISLLDPNETPWQTEINGSKRTNLTNREFISVKRGESPTPYIITAIVKGKWLDSAIEFLKTEGISIKNITKVIK